MKMISSSWSKRLPPLFLLIYLLISTAISCTAGKVQEGEELPPVPFAWELQAALDEALEANPSERALGISAAVILPGYQPWSGTSGYSHDDALLDPGMMFDMGSIAKNIEATLALQMAEEGRLDLDSPIENWIPPQRNLSKGITVRQLLNHTSGIFNVHEHPEFPWVDAGIDPQRAWRLDEVFDNFVGEPYAAPGEGQHYSSTNYLLLTAILDRVNRGDLPRELDRAFFIPLGLEHTFLSVGDPPLEGIPVAHPWVDVDGDGDLDDLANRPNRWQVTLTHPVLYSTPSDMAQWLKALYIDKNVLCAESLDEMLAIPEVREYDPEGGLFGLGVVDYSGILGMPVFGHGGSAPGYSAAALVLPEHGAVLAWAFNTGEGPTDLAASLMWDTWSSLSDTIIRNLEAGR
jgi:D-alanyl-D-alanine carboxypeptidase